MKNCIISIFILLLLGGCAREVQLGGGEVVEPLMTRGYINVTVDSENEGASSDDIKTIRFIVFKDLLSTPKVEVNEFHEVSEGTSASALSAVLEVSVNEAGLGRKLVVAIANEPTALSDELDAVTLVSQLEELRLDMSGFVATDHQSLLTGASMPMSGAIWTDSDDIYAKEEDARNGRVALLLERAVAKVDVYLNTDNSDGLQITSGSKVTLGNTYGQSYLIYHNNGANAVGRIEAPESSEMISKTWTQSAASLAVPYKTPAVQSDPSSVYLCSFYTAERSCATDKLLLDVMFRVSGDEGVKSGSVKLNELTYEDGKAFNEVIRNTTYKVTVTIGAKGMTAIVQDWKSEEITTEL
jgi:hypothetical protein